MAERIQAWEAQRKPLCLPPGEKRRKKAPPAPEPKATMIVAGLRVVLDASPTPLKRGGYPE